MESLFTTHDVARLIQVNASTVSKWIDKSILIAFRTPGGHRRVREGDLKTFLQAHHMPIPPELGAANFRLLIVDDEKSIVQSLKRALQRKAPHVEVLTATSGIEAIWLLADEKPNAALINVHMRDVDGFEVCRAVRARKSLEGVTLVMTTVAVTPAIRAKSQQAGAIQCLAKPVDVRELLALFRVPIALSHGRA
jgi:excisionase family DNA binding protein